MFPVHPNLEVMRAQGESLSLSETSALRIWSLRESSPSHFSRGSNFSLTTSLRALAASVSPSMLKPSLATFWIFFPSN